MLCSGVLSCYHGNKAKKIKILRTFADHVTLKVNIKKFKAIKVNRNLFMYTL